MMKVVLSPRGRVGSRRATFIRFRMNSSHHACDLPLPQNSDILELETMRVVRWCIYERCELLCIRKYVYIKNIAGICC